MGRKLIITGSDFSNVAISFDINDVRFVWTNKYYSGGSIVPSSGNYDSPEPISKSIVNGYKLNILDSYKVRLVAVKNDGSFIRSSESINGKIDVYQQVTNLAKDASLFSFNLSRADGGILSDEDRTNFYNWIV